MTRVFVIESPSVDISVAEEYGDITILFPRGVPCSALDTEFYAGTVISALEEAEYDKTRDLICVVGTITSLAVVLPSLARRFKAFRALIFNSYTEKYILRNLGKWKEQQ